MEKYFVTYNQALALNDLGFKEPCIATIDQTEYFHIKGTKQFPRGAMMYYTIDLPLKSQVFEWFRKEHQLFGTVLCDLCWNISGGVANSYGDVYDWDSEKFKTYEEAESDCIDKLIEIIKNK